MVDSCKRLAIFISTMRGGGAQRATLKLAGGIAGRGCAVDLVLARAEGPFLAEVSDAVRLVDLQASRVLYSLPAFVRYLRHERPDAMLSALNYVNIVALWAWRLARVPTRTVVSERNTLSRAIDMSSWRGQLVTQLIRCFYPWADGIVAVSQGVADDLAQVAGLPRERIQVIYNPIVTPELRDKVQASPDHPWFAPGEPPVLLGVGSLTKKKDFATLIQAFVQVRRTRPARLLILGEGEERAALEALIRQLGLDDDDVGLPGFVANPYPYMARASLFVLSSRWEGLPGVLIEALYCGAPLVATDCPSGPREILQGGKYGQLVPVEDVDALARAIEMTLAKGRPSPPPGSWRPFELEMVVDQYMSMLWGN